MSKITLKRLSVEEVGSLHVEAVDAATLQTASAILADVRTRGEAALIEHAVKLNDIAAGEPHILHRESHLKTAFNSLAKTDQQLLERTASRIRVFAEAQKQTIGNLSFNIAGGKAGHTVTPVDTAGCYAPGGRYPLPSSVLMTVVTARVAGVKTVWVASPHPAQITLAAAYIAGADALLAVGGAQAISAFAYGAGEVPACDAVVGPGNKYVTAAKQLVAGYVSIDMLAGPSECLVLADSHADPILIAADLIAQAEHDPDARPILIHVITDSPPTGDNDDIVVKVEAELNRQLEGLPTAEIARKSLSVNGIAVVVKGIDAAVKICDKLAPEHLELHVEQPNVYKARLRHYGGLFVGSLSAEVFGDYGAGPNHVLPTGGTARSNGGLSVFNFLKVRTWLEINDGEGAKQVMEDTAALAKLEGLAGHAAAAEARLKKLGVHVVPSKQHQQEATSPKEATYQVTPERPLHIDPHASLPLVRLALPKGRMEAGVFKLLNDAGVGLKVETRGYRPTMVIPGFDIKLLKPQNIVEMVNVGSRDIGFTGADLVEELGAKGVTSVLDTMLDVVRIVAAAPEAILTPDGEILPSITSSRKVIVVSEYKNICHRWMTKKGFTPENSGFVLSRGATEVFPPEDADIIVDNTATGSTLKANRLRAFDELFRSSTHLFVNTQLWQDEASTAKKKAIEQFVTLLKSVLDAQQQMLLEFNVEKDHLEEVCKHIPAMREPTISLLHGDRGLAVKSVVPRAKLFSLIPIIKEHGGSDIIVTEIRHIVR